MPDNPDAAEGSFDHLVLTLFSCNCEPVETCHRGRWPPGALAADRLQTRFKLFETVTVPSVLAQTDQEFGWILVIDRDLDPALKERLAAIVSPKERVWIHEYSPTPKLETIDWLPPFVIGDPDYLLTTYLDDDDAIPDDFIEVLHRDIGNTIANDRLPPIKIFGMTRVVEWDMVWSRRAPLGRVAPWHRERKITSVGLSVLARYPEWKYHIMALSHWSAMDYFDLTVPAVGDYWPIVRESAIETFVRCGEKLESWPPAKTFTDLLELCGPAVVTNHRHNILRERIVEEKPGTRTVRGPESFPGVTIDWGRAAACVREAGVSSSVLGIKRVMGSIRRVFRLPGRR